MNILTTINMIAELLLFDVSQDLQTTFKRIVLTTTKFPSETATQRCS